MGHSICGILAIEYAKAYPSHVSHVMMIGTPPGMPAGYGSMTAAYWEENASEQRRTVLRANQEVPRDTSGTMTSSDAAIADYLRATPRYWYDPTYDAAWLFEGTFYPVAGVNHLLASIMTGYSFPTPSEIAAPIFLALGRHDYVVPPVLWDDLRGQYDTMVEAVFDRSGHLPHLEEQDLFDERILEWLAAH